MGFTEKYSMFFKEVSFKLALELAIDF